MCDVTGDPAVSLLSGAGARLYSMYGQTECQRVCYLPPEEQAARPTSVGIAIPGTRAWVEDAAGRIAAAGVVGELMIQGEHVMQGYWEDPEATAARLQPGRWPWQRVLASGDLFRTDEDGYLYFVGRRDDIIKSGGEKIAPARSRKRSMTRLAFVRPPSWASPTSSWARRCMLTLPSTPATTSTPRHCVGTAPSASRTTWCPAMS